MTVVIEWIINKKNRPNGLGNKGKQHEENWQKIRGIHKSID